MYIVEVCRGWGGRGRGLGKVTGGQGTVLPPAWRACWRQARGSGPNTQHRLSAPNKANMTIYGLVTCALHVSVIKTSAIL